MSLNIAIVCARERVIEREIPKATKIATAPDATPTIPTIMNSAIKNVALRRQHAESLVLAS